MIFEINHIYHIYNQGNNHQKIFFNRENYLYFLKKIHVHILPFADVLAWCLMPNHFHLMVCVNKLKIDPGEIPNRSGTSGEGFTRIRMPGEGFTRSETFTTINDSIGVLLRSYTRAINKERNRTGSLFRRKTKAECIAKVEGGLVKASLGVKPSLLTCFDYIHQNPAKAGLAELPEKWEFSSYVDYCGLRNGKLINRQRAEELGLLK